MEKDRHNPEGFVGRSAVFCEWSQFQIWRRQSIFSPDFVGQNSGKQKVVVDCFFVRSHQVKLATWTIGKNTTTKKRDPRQIGDILKITGIRLPGSGRHLIHPRPCDKKPPTGETGASNIISPTWSGRGESNRETNHQRFKLGGARTLSLTASE